MQVVHAVEEVGERPAEHTQHVVVAVLTDERHELAAAQLHHLRRERDGGGPRGGGHTTVCREREREAQ